MKIGLIVLLAYMIVLVVMIVGSTETGLTGFEPPIEMPAYHDTGLTGFEPPLELV